MHEKWNENQCLLVFVTRKAYCPRTASIMLINSIWWVNDLFACSSTSFLLVSWSLQTFFKWNLMNISLLKLNVDRAEVKAEIFHRLSMPQSGLVFRNIRSSKKNCIYIYTGIYCINLLNWQHNERRNEKPRSLSPTHLCTVRSSWRTKRTHARPDSHANPDETVDM